MSRYQFSNPECLHVVWCCMQVAAYAERHILVEKTMHEERPLTGFRVLDTREARVAEVADMLGLDPTVAEDMLDTAQRN